MENPACFPAEFLWGTATSAYQIEGSPLADGAGPSIWHRFAHSPGLVSNGDTGDIACDHYRRFESDIRLMAELGLNAYRFSIAWGRVLPQGRGKVNPKGLDFYQRLVDALLARGIQPMVTLYHWDLPVELDNRGGWLNRETADWFGEYARTVFQALDDRVKLWVTLNEPWVVADGGYLYGCLAPGHRSLFEAPLASHNLLRAHACAVAAYRSEGRHQIGLVVNLEPHHPASESTQDKAAAERMDAYINRYYLDPVFFAAYPPELAEMFGEAWPDFPPADLEHIQRPVDFLGINYYTRRVIKNDPAALPLRASAVRQAQCPHTSLDWEVYPQGLGDSLAWVSERYGGVPLYITENGAAFDEPSSCTGQLEDSLRVEYYREHLRAACRSLQAGVDLRGYFAWSLLDNFEWSHGYSKRFGLVHVNYQTQERTPKASARFYTRVIQSRGAVLWLEN